MADLGLRFTFADASTFTFDVDGDWQWRVAAVWKDSASPPRLEELRDTWEIHGLVRSSDGTIATGWDEFLAARSKLMGASAAGLISKVDVIRDPGSAAVVELTLGSTGYESFRVDEIEGEQDDLNPAATNRVTFPIRLVLSALRRYADANDIVNWEQSVRYEYVNGLLELTWDTTITTEEGTSAVTKAQSFAGIPFSAIGSTYSYLTNGPDGIDFEILDADEENSRTPTKVRAISRVKQWGVNVGNSGPGSAPDNVSHTDTTTFTADEVTRIRRVSADGPSASSWCRALKPGWAQDTIETDRKEIPGFSIEWRAVERRTGGGREAETQWTLQGELSGGHQAFDFEPVAGGYEPVEFRGGFLPWQITVSVTVERRGGTGALSELPLPPLLQEPWQLDHNASSEGAPFRLEPGKSAAETRWRRQAKLVYRSAKKPTQDPITSLRSRSSQSVSTYYLAG